MVVSVGSNNQCDGNEVMGQHLPVILAAFLDVNDEDLLEPESKLHEDVSLVQASKFSVGPARPELLHVQPVRGSVVNVLWKDTISYHHLHALGPAPAMGPNSGFRSSKGADVHTKPRDQKVVQYRTSQACSLKRVTSFFLLMPMYLPKGARRYSIDAARSPVRRTTQNATK